MYTWQLGLSLNSIFVRRLFATTCSYIQVSLLYGILLYKNTLTYLSTLIMNIQVVLHTTECIYEHPCFGWICESISLESHWVLRQTLILTQAGYCQVGLFIWICIGKCLLSTYYVFSPGVTAKPEKASPLKSEAKGKD